MQKRLKRDNDIVSRRVEGEEDESGGHEARVSRSMVIPNVSKRGGQFRRAGDTQ